MSNALRTSCYAALLSISICASAGAAEAPPQIRVEPGTTVQVDIIPVTVEPVLKPRTGPDARHCLRLATYTAIIKCAEKYL